MAWSFHRAEEKVYEMRISIAFNGVFSSYIIVSDVLTFCVEMLDLMSNSTVNIHMKGCLLRLLNDRTVLKNVCILIR